MERPLPRPEGAFPDGAAGSARYLYRIIETVGAGSDLDTILRGVIQLVVDATGCHGCFVFFVQGRELVLRAASGVFAHAEGRVRLPAGQGLVGWAASTGRSASISDNALDDPRVLYVPELHPGEPFESMIAVPMLSRSGETVAVIGMNTRAPRTFGAHEVEFLEHAASLVAGAIEHARMFDDATRQDELLSALSDLACRIADAASADELLSEVVSGCRQLLRAERCELYLVGADHRLTLRSASPPRAAGRLAGRGLLELLSAQASDDEASARRLGNLVWGPESPGIALGAPLVVGPERLGLLCALLPEAVAGGERVLAAIASHAAVAIQRHRLIDSPPAEDVVANLFEALVLGQAPGRDVELLAARLRCDLAAPHVVAHMEPCASRDAGAGGRGRRSGRGRPAAGWSEAAGRLEGALRTCLPGALFGRRDTSVRALLPVPETGPDALVDLVRELHRKAAGGPEGAVATGLSNVTRGPSTFAGRFTEAEATARLGRLLRGGAGVSTYEELGAYRYALGTEATVRDRYQEAVETLLDYGEKRGVDLVGTLDAYLELRGGVTHTARRLGTHPNTLRQRLARIDQVTGLEVDRADWIALAMAVKTVRLRAFRSRAGAG